MKKHNTPFKKKFAPTNQDEPTLRRRLKKLEDALKEAEAYEAKLLNETRAHKAGLISMIKELNKQLRELENEKP